jgi:hypothetical protein
MLRGERATFGRCIIMVAFRIGLIAFCILRFANDGIALSVDGMIN